MCIIEHRNRKSSRIGFTTLPERKQGSARHKLFYLAISRNAMAKSRLSFPTGRMGFAPEGSETHIVIHHISVFYLIVEKNKTICYNLIEIGGDFLKQRDIEMLIKLIAFPFILIGIAIKTILVLSEKKQKNNRHSNFTKNYRAQLGDSRITETNSGMIKNRDSCTVNRSCAFSIFEKRF